MFFSNVLSLFLGLPTKDVERLREKTFLSSLIDFGHILDIEDNLEIRHDYRT
jgi:hypothetical protein